MKTKNSKRGPKLFLKTHPTVKTLLVVADFLEGEASKEDVALAIGAYDVKKLRSYVKGVDEAEAAKTAKANARAERKAKREAAKAKRLEGRKSFKEAKALEQEAIRPRNVKSTEKISKVA